MNDMNRVPMNHAGSGGDTPGMGMGSRKPAIPRSQLLAGVLITLLLLAGGIVLAGSFGDLSMRSGSSMGNMDASAGDCKPVSMPGMVMAGECTSTPTAATPSPATNGGAAEGCKPISMPGMVMAGECTPTPATGSNQGGTGGMDGMNMAGGHDMSPVDVSNASAADPGARGNQPLVYKEVDGLKQFELTASVIKWNILPNVQVGAYAYNGQVSGPEIRVTEGDRVRVIVHNQLPEATSVHWHGLQIENSMDGAADVTQAPIAPGATFTYEFTTPNTPGTYFYHTHKDADRQQPLGLYGALIIEPRIPTARYAADYTLMLGEWRVVDGKSYPAMEYDGVLPNYFTINGKAYPATETIKVRQGESVKLRFVGSGQFIHPMHVHGQPFEIVATDGNPVPREARLTKDTVLIGPGERYDVAFTARAPGKWLIHCHINHHTMNDGQEEQGGGGLVMILEVTP